jgi:starch-binding outer membrane protein, SusD/RagB family
MKNNRFVFLLIGLLSILYTGCNKKYLDTQDVNSVSPGNFPASLKDFTPLINSVYGAQHSFGLYGFAYLPQAVWNLDHTTDLQWRGSPSWNSLNNGLGIAVFNDWQLDMEWRDINSGVYYCNVVLDAIERYRAKAPASEANALDNLKGESLFMRGYFRWHLQVLFGQPDLDGMGIPLANAVPSTLEAMNIGRSTTRESYQAMINDFKAASVLLDGQTDIHRATVWSAKAALGKAYFFLGKNDSAKLVLLDCINNSGKTLLPFSNYKKIFNGDPALKHNSESFYEAEFVAQPDVSGGGPWSAMAGTSMGLLFAPWYIASDSVRKGAAWSNMYMHDRNLTRFGYNDETFLSAVTGTTVDPVYVARQLELRKGTDYINDPDPRLYVASLQPWIDSIKFQGSYRKIAQSEGGKWYTMPAATGNDPAKYFGWPVKKYNFIDEDLATVKYIYGSNVYFIRLPDIYLMYAEIIKSTDPSTALEYVNKVHRRAWGYDADSHSAVDYVSLTDATKAPADDESLHNNPLLYERFAEFFGEGKWWEEVKRLQIGPKESAFYKTCCGNIPIGWVDSQYALPINKKEFEVNTNPGMKQNPGPWN